MLEHLSILVYNVSAALIGPSEPVVNKEQGHSGLQCITPT